MEKLLTIPELAEYLGICPTTAYRWASQNRLKCIRLGRRCVRFRLSDVEDYIRSALREDLQSKTEQTLQKRSLTHD